MANPVRVVLQGNEDLARSYLGEATNFLYVLTNRMGTGGLKSLSHNHILPDGTVINVSSHYGEDQIVISSPPPQEIEIVEQAEEGSQSCRIVLGKWPSVVQPMKNPGEIKQGEVAGIDYIVTPYQVDIQNCPECSTIKWGWAYCYTNPNQPLIYVNQLNSPAPSYPLTDGCRTKSGYTVVQPGKSDPACHWVYSDWPPPYFQIIKGGGSFPSGVIKWKAFTEAPDIYLAGDNTGLLRTGLAALLIQASVLGPDGSVLCSTRKQVRVDCCKMASPSVRPPVQIWWEDNCSCQPFHMFSGGSCGALCKAPTSMPMGGTSGLNWYACMFPQQAFYTTPNPLINTDWANGLCLPVTWTLNGPFDFWYGTGPHSEFIKLRCLDNGCFSEGSITLADRCGGSYTIKITPCCGNTDPLVIHYTSLVMSCGQQQSFYGTGGCGPYVWSCDHGTIDQGGNYTSPSSNANCTENPTITVTDCCGTTETIRLAVNCSHGTYIATTLGTIECGKAYLVLPSDPTQGACIEHNYTMRYYYCDGTLASTCVTGWNSCYGVEQVLDCSKWYFQNDACCTHDCYTNQCGGCGGVANPCGNTVDCRDSIMKADGCCPINPDTGLPF